MSRFEDVITHRMIDPDWTGCSGEHMVEPGQMLEAARWCRRTFVTKDWTRFGYDFWFRRTEDATLFVLRWGK